MTMASHELRAKGVAEYVISRRRWRRERGLTIQSMACMIGVSTDTLHRAEIGRQGPSASLRAKIDAFVERWAAVPALQEAVAREAHQLKLRYRAAALGRARARGFNVPGEP